MDRISEAGEFVAAALKQGVILTTGEADMLLGYLEGHDYCLMVDDEGVTVRHDEQYREDHSEDEPYTVQAVIEFCQEMNADLIHENSSSIEPDEEYLTHLRKDEQILDALAERVTGLCQPQEAG